LFANFIRANVLFSLLTFARISINSWTGLFPSHLLTFFDYMVVLFFSRWVEFSFTILRVVVCFSRQRSFPRLLEGHEPFFRLLMIACPSPCKLTLICFLSGLCGFLAYPSWFRFTFIFCAIILGPFLLFCFIQFLNGLTWFVFFLSICPLFCFWVFYLVRGFKVNPSWGPCHGLDDKTPFAFPPAYSFESAGSPPLKQAFCFPLACNTAGLSYLSFP